MSGMYDSDGCLALALPLLPPCRCVFYYSGAASRAGLSYSGAILASKEGQWPTSQVSVGRAVRPRRAALCPSMLWHSVLQQC